MTSPQAHHQDAQNNKPTLDYPRAKSTIPGSNYTPGGHGATDRAMTSNATTFPVAGGQIRNFQNLSMNIRKSSVGMAANRQSLRL